MRIIIDAMGGDNAPEEIVHGAADAAREFDATIVLVGNESVIRPIAQKYGFPEEKLEIIHTDIVLTMEDNPLDVRRKKKDSSMGLGLRALVENGDAFVSAGNTGALHAGSSLIVRPLKGIKRTAIATLLPFERPVLMLDCGANINQDPECLEQWARLGSIYMKNILGVKEPCVGLLNNGAEEHKGTPAVAEANGRLAAAENIKFIGNVEGSQIPQSVCDVLVTDGFTGNITLKLIEGMGKFVFGRLKSMFTKNVGTKMSYVLMKDQLRGLKKDFDASEYGGAPFLGLSKPVIKAHGNSDARAIFNAVRQAIAFAETGVTEQFDQVAALYRDAADDTSEGTEE